MGTTTRNNQGDTRKRLLEATEWLFVEHGYEALSLRQITTRAGANLAAVNYHFGSKEALVRELLSQRLDRLNHERLKLLAECEQKLGGDLNAATILGILFVPAFRLGQGGDQPPGFMRLLGRVYSDPSPFIRDHLEQHYRPISGRFFEAFAHALPSLPRRELGLRVHFALKAVSGILAGEDMQALIASMARGQSIPDNELLARLISLVSPILTAPFAAPEQIRLVDRLMLMDRQTATSGTPRSAEPPDTGQPPAPPWMAQATLGQ